jgi:hypothetical protein
MIGKETAGTKYGTKRVRVSIRCSVDAMQSSLAMVECNVGTV